MAMTTTTDVAYFLPSYYDKVFLEVFQPIPKAADYCMMKPLPLHQGKVAYFPKMTATADTPGSYTMTEGTPITPETFVDEQVAAAVVPFGNAKGISDFTELTAIDSTTEELVKNLAVQANNLLDKQILSAAYNSGATGYTVYKSTATSVSASVSLGTSYGGFPVIVANADFVGSASTAQTDLSCTTAGLVSAINSCGGVDSVISAATIRRATGKLKAKNVTPLEKGYYAFLCHTDIAMTLLADSSITDLYKYTKEIGALGKQFLMKNYLNSGKLLRDNPDPSQTGGSNDYEQTNVLELRYWNDIGRFLFDTCQKSISKFFNAYQPFNQTARVFAV